MDKGPQTSDGGGEQDPGHKTEGMATEVGRKQETVMSWKHGEGDG